MRCRGSAAKLTARTYADSVLSLLVCLRIFCFSHGVTLSPDYFPLRVSTQIVAAMAGVHVDAAGTTAELNHATVSAFATANGLLPATVLAYFEAQAVLNSPTPVTLDALRALLADASRQAGMSCWQLF